MDKYFSLVDPRQNMRGFIVAILILIGLGTAVGVVVTSPPGSSDVAPREEIKDARFSSPNVFVYAYWAGDKSEVKSFDLSTGEELLIATLPLNIKHIKLLSPTEIVYISDTDEKDYGSKIVIKKIPEGEERVVVQASDGVRIDDYRVSSSGRFIATWEVSTAPDTGQLYGGVSRVYSADVNAPGTKNLIYSEDANAPVHYPVAVTDSGQIFLDTYLPNDSAGWGYGMSMSDFTGSSREDLVGIANGTYGSQPIMSPDGTRLTFVGYDGSKGSGTEVVNGVRRAVLSSNTVDVLDLDTLSRTRLSNLPADNLYSKAWWDEITGNVLFSLISKNANETGTYSYHLQSNLYEKIDLGLLKNISSNPNKVISVLSPGVVLVGSITNTETALGNLGREYEQALEGVYVINSAKNDVVTLDIVGGFVQSISTKPSSFFGSSSALFSTDSTTGGIKNKKTEQLQLNTFTIKPTLAPQRIGQQSGESCRNVAAARCNDLLGTDFTGDEAATARSTSVGFGEEFSACVKEQWTDAQQTGVCSDSPLYLYGDKGMKVNVKVGTPVTETDIPYSPADGFDGRLTGDGGVVINELIFSSIEFDYKLASQFDKPARGVVIDRAKLTSELKNYAERLGMNEKETYDFVNYIKQSAPFEKIFLSHFSHEISSGLLPLYFTPEPDSYTNIVFYVADASKITQSIDAPEFEKIKRNGFSAVEISYILTTK